MKNIIRLSLLALFLSPLSLFADDEVEEGCCNR
ncbi:MAG: hypothetical protein Ct9H300mP3_11320 [Gammaproteobacteria bacterium]|nr:MAG: hypothetical protein Ct9H300mP3_11320 [Gammaproteobacteria bacterium]